MAFNTDMYDVEKY